LLSEACGREGDEGRAQLKAAWNERKEGATSDAIGSGPDTGNTPKGGKKKQAERDRESEKSLARPDRARAGQVGGASGHDRASVKQRILKGVPGGSAAA